MDEELINRKVARRRLLRRAGTVAATVAGAGAVGVAIASPAEANIGDNLVVGNPNNGQGNATTLTNNSSANPTMVLGNSAITGPINDQEAGPALQLLPAGDFVGGPVGSIGMSTDGTLWAVRPVTGGIIPDFVRTGANSTILKSFNPVRMLDTRPEQAAGKAGIMNPGVIDGAGFLMAGQTLNLNLDSLLVWGWTIFANITVVAGNQSGFVTAYPGGVPRPLASNVNYTPGLIVANFAAISVGSLNPADNVISIWVPTPAKIIVDVAGAVVNYDSDIKPGGGGSALSATSAKVRERPARLSGR